MNKDVLHSRAISNLHAVQQANFYCLRHTVWWNDSNALKPLPMSRLCVHQMSSGLAVWREWRTWPYHRKSSFCLVEMPSLPVFGHGEKDGNQVPPTWNSRRPSSYHKRNTLESTSLNWKRIFGGCDCGQRNRIYEKLPHTLLSTAVASRVKIPQLDFSENASCPPKRPIFVLCFFRPRTSNLRHHQVSKSETKSAQN